MKRLILLTSMISILFGANATIANAITYHKDYSPRYGYCGPNVVGAKHDNGDGTTTECTQTAATPWDRYYSWYTYNTPCDSWYNPLCW